MSVVADIVAKMPKHGINASNPPSVQTRITRLRDSHHLLAKLLAIGIPEREVCRQTGYTFERLRRLRLSPAFQELVAGYAQAAEPAVQEQLEIFAELATKNMIMAQRMIADALEEADENGEPIPLKTLLAIAGDGGDRFGYPKRAMNINGNVTEFAAALERAAQRSGVGARQVGRALAAPGGSLAPPVPPVGDIIEAEIISDSAVAPNEVQEQQTGNTDAKPSPAVAAAVAAPASRFRRPR